MDFLPERLRLSEINEIVAEVVGLAFPTPLWVIAEVSSVSTAGGAGHIYVDLVEKRGDEVLAQCRAQIWSSRRDKVACFERTTRRKLERGMQILVLARPKFSARYGYGLEILDIDGTFTLGDMARKRQEVIDRLTDEGLLDRNRGLGLSPAPLRVAVVTSPTAAGWGDFDHRLSRNVYGYRFSTTLFSAQVQGDAAERSIVRALTEIERAVGQFDCVVLLRGGGATVDMSCFDGLDLALAVARFPLPVLCGIGHERDRCVCDMVAHHAASTPTAVAEFLISRVRTFEEEIISLGEAASLAARSTLGREAAALQQTSFGVISTAQTRIRIETESLHGLARSASVYVRTSVAERESELSRIRAKIELLPAIRLRDLASEHRRIERDLSTAVNRILEIATTDVKVMESEIRSRDPADILRRGFSITRSGGKAVRDVRGIEVGQELETVVSGGRIRSVVRKTEGSE